MRDYRYTNRFIKDLALMEKRGINIDKVHEVMELIIQDKPLPARCRPHKLSGNLSKFTECHALNDVLLLYEIDEEKVTFSRLGTHSDLF